MTATAQVLRCISPEYLAALGRVFPEADLSPARAASYLAAGWRVLVLECGGQVLGGAHWRPLELPDGAGWIAAMDFVWVGEEHRGAGLGTTLMRHVFEDIERVCPAAVLAVDTIHEPPGDGPRWRFWRRFGAIDLGPVTVPYAGGVREERLAAILTPQGLDTLRRAYLESL